MRDKTFTHADVGCYADGALGHDHVRARLRDLLRGIDGEDYPGALMTDVLLALSGDMSDDAWEEQEALGILNDVTEPGVSWALWSGDLVLAEDDRLDGDGEDMWPYADFESTGQE